MKFRDWIKIIKYFNNRIENKKERGINYIKNKIIYNIN